MRSTFIKYLFLVVGLCGCNRNNVNSLSDFKELKDTGMVIQVMKLKGGQEESSVIKYGVRIFPDKQLLLVLSEENKQALWYKMDSSFYIKSGSKKYYADMTEPIANGQKNNFEYLLMFEIAPEMNFKDITLAFNDQYLGYKTHYLQLNSK